MESWIRIFKALGNEKRLRILVELSREREMPVHKIANRIDMGVKTTSKHLIILANLGFLRSRGKLGSVWYRLNPEAGDNLRRAIKLFT